MDMYQILKKFNTANSTTTQPIMEQAQVEPTGLLAEMRKVEESVYGSDWEGAEVLRREKQLQIANIEERKQRLISKYPELAEKISTLFARAGRNIDDAQSSDEIRTTVEFIGRSLSKYLGINESLSENKKCASKKTVAEGVFDDEDNSPDEFFVVLDSNGKGSFVGMVYKDSNRWVEQKVAGNAPYNWGGTYMGYLTPKEIMAWIKQDYTRYDVDGPFSSEDEARERAFGVEESLSEGVMKEVDIDIKDLSNFAFKKKYGMSKQQFIDQLSNKKAQNTALDKQPRKEANLEEGKLDDLRDKLQAKKDADWWGDHEKPKAKATSYVHKGTYGTAYHDTDGDDDDHEDKKKSKKAEKDDAPKKRGRPKGSKRATGAKGPSGHSKIMRESNDTDSQLLKKILNNEVDIYDVLAGDYPNNRKLQQKLDRMYDSISAEQRLHPDDDFEEIIKQIHGELEAQYGGKLNEKAVSKKQQRFMGMVHAAQKGEEPASAKVAAVAKTMSKKAAKDFAATKHSELDEISGKTLGSYVQKARTDIKGKRQHADSLDADPKVKELQGKVSNWYKDRVYRKDGTSIHANKIVKARADIEKQKKKIDPEYPGSVNTGKRYKGIEKAVDKLQRGKLTDSDSKQTKEVEETTSGSVATSTQSTGSIKGVQVGKGIYDSINREVEAMIAESMDISVNVGTGENGNSTKNVSVNASGDDADVLAQMLKMAGLGSSGYNTVRIEPEISCGEEIEEELSNSPDEQYADTDTMVNKLSGGLNKRHMQINPNNPADNSMAMSKLGRAHSGQIQLGEEEAKIKEGLVNLYKKYQG